MMLLPSCIFLSLPFAFALKSMTRILVSKDPFETEKSTSIYFTFKADVFADSSLASSLVLSWGWNERKESCSLPVGLFGQNLCRMMLIPLPSLSFLCMYQSPCCSLSLSIPCLLPSLALVSCSGLLVRLPSSSFSFLLLLCYPWKREACFPCVWRDRLRQLTRCSWARLSRHLLLGRIECPVYDCCYCTHSYFRTSLFFLLLLLF